MQKAKTLPLSTVTTSSFSRTFEFASKVKEDIKTLFVEGTAGALQLVKTRFDSFSRVILTSQRRLRRYLK